MKQTIKLMPTIIAVLSICLALVLTSEPLSEVLSKTQLEHKTHTIIIDAGHGGVDGGAISCTGALESQINLEIALRLEELLHFLGFETKMIRRTDVSVYTEGATIAAKKISDLKNRVKIVNETDGGILISIHQNQFSDSKYSGAQVFYGKNEKAKDLAIKLQTALVSNLNIGSKRKAKLASGVYLMDKITNPGVLIECGFLSNLNEEALLRDPQYQKKLCAVIGATLSSYFGQGSKVT